MATELVKIEGNTVTLNRAELVFTSAYNKLLLNSKDAIKEFGIIWWINNPQSPGIQEGLTGKKLILHALDNVGLPKDWQPSPLWEAANNKYKEEWDRTNVAVRIYKSLLASFVTGDKVIMKLREQLEETLDVDDLGPQEVSIAVTTLNQLLELADKLPKRLESIMTAKDLMEKSLSGKATQRGGDIVSDSMNRPS